LKPSRTPTTSQPWCCPANVTARITALRPGASPPPLHTAIRLIARLAPATCRAYVAPAFRSPFTASLANQFDPRCEAAIGRPCAGSPARKAVRLAARHPPHQPAARQAVISKGCNAIENCRTSPGRARRNPGAVVWPEQFPLHEPRAEGSKGHMAKTNADLIWTCCAGRIRPTSTATDSRRLRSCAAWTASWSRPRSRSSSCRSGTIPMEFATLIGDPQGVPQLPDRPHRARSPNVRGVFDGFRLIDDQGPGHGQQLPR
jgi:hypothetical protein